MSMAKSASAPAVSRDRTYAGDAGAEDLETESWTEDVDDWWGDEYGWSYPDDDWDWSTTNGSEWSS